MARLSSIEHYQGQIQFIAKFNNNVEWLESLRNGQIFMNRLGLYKEIEKREGKKGMGDSFDGHTVIRNIQNISVYDADTGEIVGSGTASEVTFAFDDVLDMPVFCSLAIGPEFLEIIGEDKDTYFVEIVFNEEELNRIIDAFGKHMLLMEYAVFVEEFKQAAESQEFSFVGRKAKYVDYSINQQERLEGAQTIDVAFWKSDELKYQYEHRFVLTTRGLQTPFIAKTSDLREHSYIMLARDLVEKHIRFGVPKPKIVPQSK
jgi:hypothetical protein